MSTQTLKKRKLFMPWQDQQQEDWLREMSQQGWQLDHVYFPATYKFERVTPRDTIYRLDFKEKRKDRETYLQIFEDAGWEHVQSFNGWQYFRKPAEAGQGEIFTDTSSKVEKYRRIRDAFVTLLLVYALLTWVALTGNGDINWFTAPCLSVEIAGIVAFGVSALKLQQRINALSGKQL